MKKSLVALYLMCIGITLLFANLSDAVFLSDIPGNVMFAGRQAVSAEGNNLAFCYTSYQQNYPEQSGTIYYQYSTNGGLTYQRTMVTTEFHFDGYPSLCKDGQEVIITYSAGGHIKRALSSNGGISFEVVDTVQGSDRLPITDKYDGEYHSLYNYQDFEPDYRAIESPHPNIDGAFIDKTLSSNDTPRYFWGPDVVYGKVRCNDDIWVKQAGGGTNNGWPTFYCPVVTSGLIQSLSGTPPYPQIFRAGYFENIPEVPLDAAGTYEQIASQATVVGNEALDPNLITMITVNGTNYTTMLGQIQVNGFDIYQVYSDYPPGNGAPLFANTIPHVDTLWTVGPSGSTTGNTMFMVNSPLWIRGTFTGTQTWYSRFNVFLMDDITLTGTPLGQTPDGSETGSNINPTDKVAIVSGKSIFIQYGYKDPVTNVRMKPNCDGNGTANGGGAIWIYASLYALGDGNGVSQNDGVFTFEYQHPHPSIPAVSIDNPEPTVFDNIDLHRRHYPQTGADPWSPNIDYPYYNPLWPEGNPLMERGTIHQFGSIVQRRWGYTHRSINETDYPNPNGQWDIAVDLCGGPSGVVVVDPVLNMNFGGVNAPDATGGGVGYSFKDYHYDYRIKGDTFGFNPWNYRIRMDSATDIGNWQPEAAKLYNDKFDTKVYQRKYAQRLFSLNDRLFRYQDNALTELSNSINARGNIVQMDMLNPTDVLIYKHDRNIHDQDMSYTPDTLHVFILNLDNGSTTSLVNSHTTTEMHDTAILGNSLKVFARTNAVNEVQLYAINADNQLIPFYTWNPNQAMFTNATYEFSRARMTVVPSGGDSLYVMIWLPFNDGQAWHYPTMTGALFIANGAFTNTGIGDDPEETVPVKLLLANYPNPFNPVTTISYSLPKAAEANLNIYNAKGQLVRTLVTGVQSAGAHKIAWNGQDENNQPCGSGVYFYRLVSDKLSLQRKMIMMK